MDDARGRIVYEVARRHSRGESIRGIARALRIDRKTVKRMLREVAQRREAGDDALERVQRPRRAPRGSKLDAYDGVIAELLQAYPDIRATRLLEELRGRGFDGGYTIVRERLGRARRPPKPRVFNVVRTEPGLQGQVDWSPYKLADGTPMYCFSCVLSYSRYQYARFCADMRQPTLFRQLRATFEAFGGGVPRELVFDSMPGIVDRWELDQPVLNIHAVDFATYYGFELHIAPRGDGAYKGKVERPFRYIEESLLNARTFHTLDQANATMVWWLEHRANPRTHRMTKRRPVDALTEEQPSLNTLPAKPYDDRELAYRLVSSYGYIDFDGNHYRAPTEVGAWVYVRADDEEVSIVAGPARVVARHPRGLRNAGEWIPTPVKRKRRCMSELFGIFEAWGTTALRYAHELQQRKRYAGAELAQIIAQRETYSSEDILAAIEHANRYAAYGAQDIERILKAKATPRTYEDHLAARARDQIRRTMADTPVRQRGLDAYARLLAAPAVNEDARCESNDGEEDEDPT